MKKLLTNLQFKQFIKFSVVGVSGTVIDWIFYFIFTRWLFTYYLIAKALSFIFAAANNYFWNRVWTFRSKDKNIVKQFIKFFAVSVIGLFINILIMYIVVNDFKLSDFYGLIIATAIVMFWNFFANKLWTFKEKE